MLQTERTPLEEAVEGEDPEIVSLIMKAEAKTKAKVRRNTCANVFPGNMKI